MVNTRLNNFIDEGDIIVNTANEEFLVTGYDEQRQMVRFFARHREIKVMFERPLYKLNADNFTFKADRKTVHETYQIH